MFILCIWCTFGAFISRFIILVDSDEKKKKWWILCTPFGLDVSNSNQLRGDCGPRRGRLHRYLPQIGSPIPLNDRFGWAAAAPQLPSKGSPAKCIHLSLGCTEWRRGQIAFGCTNNNNNNISTTVDFVSVVVDVAAEVHQSTREINFWIRSKFNAIFIYRWVVRD